MSSKSKQKGKPNFTNGDIVYTKVFQKTLRGAMPVSFPGMAACMLLGHVPQNGIDLTVTQVMRILGSNGFILMDDVAEFLTPEQAEICVLKFEEKYWPKKVEDTAPAESVQPEEILPPKHIILTDKETSNEH